MSNPRVVQGGFNRTNEWVIDGQIDSWYTVNEITCSTTDLNITLPAHNTFPIQLLAYKMDNTAYKAQIYPNSGDTILGTTSAIVLEKKNDWVLFFCNGTSDIKVISRGNCQPIIYNAIAGNLLSMDNKGINQDSGFKVNITDPFTNPVATELSDNLSISNYVLSLFNSNRALQPVALYFNTNQNLSGLPTQNGYTCVDGDRVALAGQTNSAENLIYVVHSGAWTIATDSNTVNKLLGSWFAISKGTYSGAYSYLVSITPTSGNIAPTAVTWSTPVPQNVYQPLLIANTAKTSNFTAETNNIYEVDTTSNIIIATLPSSGSNGDRITIHDKGGNTATKQTFIASTSSTTTFTATTTNGSAVLTSITGSPAVGQLVTGTGIPTGTVIEQISPSVIMSNLATASGSITVTAQQLAGVLNVNYGSIWMAYSTTMGAWILSSVATFDNAGNMFIQEVPSWVTPKSNQLVNWSYITSQYVNLAPVDTLQVFVGANGSDTSGKGTIFSPFLTLTKAESVVTGSGNVLVGTANYNEALACIKDNINYAMQGGTNIATFKATLAQTTTIGNAVTRRTFNGMQWSTGGTECITHTSSKGIINFQNCAFTTTGSSFGTLGANITSNAYNNIFNWCDFTGSSTAYLNLANNTNNTFTGTLTSGNANITVTAGSVTVGQWVTGTGIKAGSLIISVIGSIATMNYPASASGSQTIYKAIPWSFNNCNSIRLNIGTGHIVFAYNTNIGENGVTAGLTGNVNNYVVLSNPLVTTVTTYANMLAQNFTNFGGVGYFTVITNDTTQSYNGIWQCVAYPFTSTGSAWVQLSSSNAVAETLTVTTSNQNVASFSAVNNSTPNNNTGAIYRAIQNNGSATLNNHTLGNYQYAGAYNSSNGIGVGVNIYARATQNWSTTAQGTRLIFQVTPNDSITLTDVLTLNQDQTASFTNDVTGVTATLGDSSTKFATTEFVQKNANLIGDVKSGFQIADHSGWLIWTNGRSLSRTTYARLWSFVQENSLVTAGLFGNGDGSTTFTMGDINSRAIGIVGSGTGLSTRALGAKVGAETHTLTAGEMPSHYHDNTMSWSPNNTHNHSNNNGVFAEASNGGGGGTYTKGSTYTGNDQAHNNMQPTVFFNLFVYSGV